ncbi:phosphoadenosine phosphosulfate reductase family protein [Pedobacter psychrotolerans]|uniref:phosphoadenosine phosphosulfate reductase domain-containing protein n=1 Tax=Pedobacter psychrotolerans TaxID=1843235 RepID=UPI003F955F6D
MNKVRHVLGISGGKDSAALAIYLKNLYPQMEIDYYSSDTGKELDETYELINNLEIYLGKSINILKGAENSHEDPFDHFLKMYGGFLPSSNARWCTKKLKLEPFEKYVGDDLVVSYVGIRGDEDREGYISRKTNIQSIFPFRRNIWSEDVIEKFLANNRQVETLDSLSKFDLGLSRGKFEAILRKEVSMSFNMHHKLNQLLDLGVKETNYLIHEFLKTTKYPLAYDDTYFPLLENEDNLVRSDIFKILEETGVGVPAYYKKIDFEIDGKVSSYARSRSGCFFCFYQQKIEWVWLFEQHNELFLKAMEYEKDGYNWVQGESLEQLSAPDRILQIKRDYAKRQDRLTNKSSQFLVDILDDEEGVGCASCFI